MSRHHRKLLRRLRAELDDDTRAALERAINTRDPRESWSGRLRVRCPRDDGSADP